MGERSDFESACLKSVPKLHLDKCDHQGKDAPKAKVLFQILKMLFSIRQIQRTELHGAAKEMSLFITTKAHPILSSVV